ncbi:MAG: hypothetical protein IJA54_03540 [Tyzzerella sp.]|nr:hypothetical protein [Tyzzerella sp.]
MFEFICVTVAIIIILIATSFGIKNRNDMSKWISCVLLGIFFSAFFMVLPTEWVKEGKIVENAGLYSILSSLLYSFKVLGGRQDIAQLETIALDGVFKTIYIYVNYIMFALSPILASSLILSFIGDTGDKIRYVFSWSPKCYVFSEINENALALAKGLANKSGKKTLIFCNAKNADKSFITKAKKTGALLLYKSCEDIKINKKFRTYEFCLISNDEDNNLKLTESITTKLKPSKRTKIIINSFVESGTNVKFLESVFKSKKNIDTNMELRCIDEIALFCNQLIYEHPLYNTKDNGNNISVVIIGCGKTGMRMLKTVYWAGQIDGYSLKIRVYDKNAEKIRKEFYGQCPGLKDEKTIGFIETNVNTLDFKKELLSQENSLDATYIVVAMGDDQLNLSVSDDLYRIYRKSRSFNDGQMPEIFTRVRSEVKTNSYFDNIKFLNDRHIHLFGTTESIFSDTTLFNTELENMAFAVHLAYWKRLNTEKSSEEYKEVYRDFKTSEYDRRSSMATALHIPAKLCMVDGIPKSDKNILTTENINMIAECLKNDKDLCNRLAMNEHKRWNAFMLSEGYQTATLEDMMLYSKTTKEHKDELSMLHPCITDWDALDKLEKTFNEAYNKDKQFKFYDQEIIEKIPVIWEKTQEMNGDD